MKLLGKIIIKGTIETLTGLHIGGSKSSLNIGGVDNNVIKTVKGKPYIPGSSLKGKLRSLLAKKAGSLFFSKQDKETFLKSIEKDLKKDNPEITDDEINKDPAVKLFSVVDTDESIDNKYIVELFGYSGDTNDKNKDKVNYTSLLVRDAFLSNGSDSAVFPKEEGVPAYTDSKFENVINRRTGTAEHPRQMERVPVGAKFNFELVYNVFENANVETHLNHIVLALKLLKDDFIGGQGSRGYGQINIIPDLEKTVLRKIDGDKYVEKGWTVGEKDYTFFKEDLQKI